MTDNCLIIIDPGHGGSEIGAVGNGFMEKNLNLTVALELHKILRNYLSNLLMTRISDTYFDLTARAKWIAEKAAAFPGITICMCVHFNSFDGTARGAETVYSLNASSELATNILQKLGELGIPMRSAYTRESSTSPGKDYYAMHRETGTAQTVIIESLFIDNSDDIALIKTPDFLQRIAQKQAEGLLKYLRITPASTPHEDNPPQPKPHWALQDFIELREYFRQRSISISDHSGRLDSPATEGLVFRLLNLIRKAGS